LLKFITHHNSYMYVSVCALLYVDV
jgi:hypothetical protein